MKKRPVCMAAAFWVLIIFCWYGMGASKQMSPWLSKGSEDAGQVSLDHLEKENLQIFGQVAGREKTAYGLRLYLRNSSVWPEQSPQNQNQQKNQNQQNQNQSDQNKSDPDKSNQLQSKQILVYLKNSTNIQLNTYPIGQWLLLSGKGQLPDPATNPGQFDVRSYYQARNIVLYLKEAVVQKKNAEKDPYRNLLEEFKDRLISSYYDILGEEDGAMLCGISLGAKSELPKEKKILYQEGGIAHILAVSALHITVLGMGCYQLLRRLRVSFLGAGTVSAFFMFSFCVMSGMSVSAQRSCIMFLIWLGSQVLGRTCDRPVSAAAAMLVILIRSPQYLGDSGFLLSFGCILSIILVVPLGEQLIACGKFGRSLAAGAALQVGTLPIVMYFFFQITPYGILLNLIVVPLMTVLMASGLLGALAGIFFIPLGTLIAAPCHYLLLLFEKLCCLERQLPGAVLITGRPGWWQILLYYLLLLLAGMVLKKVPEAEKKKKSRGSAGAGNRTEPKTVRLHKGVACLVLLAGFTVLFYRPEQKLRMTFLDVGQGDGILVEAGDFTAVIDGGSSSVSDVWKNRMEGTLKCYGISKVDYVFLSHGDQDHINGIVQWLEAYETNRWGDNIGSITINNLVLPDIGEKDEKLEKLKSLAGQQGIRIWSASAGTVLEEAGGIKLNILAPDREHLCGDSNQDSMVIRLQYGSFSALLTGDLEEDGERALLERAVTGEMQEKITVLKVAHHGSRNGTSEAFLQKFLPEYAVISCGKKNRYGHPAAETVERLEKSGCMLYNTADNGAVVVWSDGKNSRVRCFGIS